VDTVTIDVTLIGLLAVVGGRPEIRCEVPTGTSLPTFISQLSEELPPDFKSFALEKNGDVYPGIMFIIDSKLIPPRFINTCLLEKDCVLKIMPIVSGG